MKTFLVTTFALAALALVACGDEETVNPLGGTTSGGGASGSTTGSGNGTPDGGVKRTVLQHNPFGDVAETQNLLWDGDFEWFSAFSDEYGWVSGPPWDSFTFTGVIVGPKCRSGLRCEDLPVGGAIIGIGVASKGDALEVSFWAKPAKGECTGVEAYVESYNNFFYDVPAKDPHAPVKSTSKTPGADGYCHFDTVIDARTEKPALYIGNLSKADVIIDDCVMKVAEKGKKAERHVMDPAAEERLRRVTAELRKRPRGPHDMPPNEARRAFESWKKR